MAKSKVSSAVKDADHGHAALEAEVAKLKKEVAALKRSLASASKGGADPRVDKLIEALLLQSTNAAEANKLVLSLKQ